MSQPSPASPPTAAGSPAALRDLTRLIQRSSGLPEVLAALKNGRSGTIDGTWGSAGPLTLAALGLHAPKTLVVVMAHVGDVDDFRDDLATFAGIMPEVFPAWEKLPSRGRSKRRGLQSPPPDDQVVEERHASPPRFVVAPIQAFLQPVPTSEALDRATRTDSRWGTPARSRGWRPG